MIINALYIVLCVVAALDPRTRPGLAMSVPGLILVNAGLHTGATLVFRRYAPGLVSALLLYVPLGAAALYLAVSEGLISSPAGIINALLLGLAWHAVPPLVVLANQARR